jgi:hypothetical protein
MNKIRSLLALVVAVVLVTVPIGAVQANDAHHPGSAATKQLPAKAKAKTPKTNIRALKQSGLLAPGVKEPLRGVPS